MEKHLETLKHYVIDINHYNLYCSIVMEYYKNFKSINELKQYRKNSKIFCEAHHILPKSLNGKNSCDNMVVLPASKHLEAHYHLYKATMNKKMIFAFNQMRRYIKNHDISAGFNIQITKWYEEARHDISISISEMRKLYYENITDAEKQIINEKISKSTKGKVPVIFLDTGHITTIKTTEFDDSLHRYVSTGTTKSDSCKKLMSHKAKPEQKGYVYHDPITREIGFYKKGTEPIGWIKGNGIPNKHTKNTFFYHNPLTWEQKRFQLDCQPNGWVKGRCKFNNAFNKPILKHMVTGDVIIDNMIKPFYTHIRRKCVYLYSSIRYGKIVTPNPEIICDDIGFIDVCHFVKQANDHTLKYTTRSINKAMTKFLNTNVAVDFNVIRISKDDLTMEMCDKILIEYTWKVS